MQVFSSDDFISQDLFEYAVEAVTYEFTAQFTADRQMMGLGVAGDFAGHFIEEAAGDSENFDLLVAKILLLTQNIFVLEPEKKNSPF